MTQPEEPKPKEVFISTKELWVYSGISIVSLIIANVVFVLSFSDPVVSITVEDSKTFSIFDEKLTFIINDDLSFQSKNVQVYGFNGPTSINISSSEFVEDKSGDKISLTFNVPHIDNIGQNPKIFSIALEPIREGLYHGAIFITSNGNYTSVPIQIYVKPQMILLIIIVVDGIAFSIAAWSVIRFLNGRYKIYKEVRNNQLVDIEPDPDEPLSIKQFLKVKKVTRQRVVENAILTGGTILFGIGLGLVALIDNTFIAGIYNLGALEILTLIGIGMGIGSLKEFLYKP
jgi:hypothetical protein